MKHTMRFESYIANLNYRQELYESIEKCKIPHERTQQTP